VSLTVRRAKSAEDVRTVATMWQAAQAWLADQGSDQWQYPVRIHTIEETVEAGECWLIENDSGKDIATVTVDERPDPALWTPQDSPESAVYVHRLVVGQSSRGNDLGSAILDWVARSAQARGKQWVRLDAWTTNTRLHDYYLKRGFRRVRIVRDPDEVSGALFQRQAVVQLNRGPQILGEATPPTR
jgi:GNAT superfamily N-acetyltransferase